MRKKTVLNPHRNCLLNHHFSSHLVHALSEHWYYTSDLSELYDTLSLTNRTLLTVDTILWCTKKILFQIDDFRFPFHRKNYNSLLLLCPLLFHLTSCTPTKSNLFLANSLAAAVSETALYRLLTFDVPNLISLFRCLIPTKVSVQARIKCSCFVRSQFLWWGFLSTSSNPLAGGSPLVGCPQLLIQ